MPLKTRSQRKSPGRNYSPSAESNAAAVPADKEEEETHAEASVGSLQGNEDSIKTRQDSCETERSGSPELGVSVPMSETEISIKRKENDNENDTSEESFQPPAPSTSGNKERASLSPTKQLSREIAPSLQTGSTNDKVAADNLFSPRKSTQSQSVRSIDRSPRARSPWQSHSGSSQERLQQRPSPNNHRHGGAHQRVTEQLEAQTTSNNRNSNHRESDRIQHRDDLTPGRGPMPLQPVSSLNSITAELELAGNDCDFGPSVPDCPSVTDCLDLGSFGAESPQRSTHEKGSGRGGARRSPRTSPQNNMTQQQQPPVGYSYPQSSSNAPFYHSSSSQYRPSPPAPHHHHSHASQPIYGGGPGGPRSQAPPPYNNNYAPNNSSNIRPPPHSAYSGGGPNSGYLPPTSHGVPYPPRYMTSSSSSPHGDILPPTSGDYWHSPRRAFPESPYRHQREQETHQGSSEMNNANDIGKANHPMEASPNRHPIAPSPSSRKRDWERSNAENAATPSKSKSGQIGELPLRSPYRSPLTNMEQGAIGSSGRKLKRSPLFHTGIPNIGYYGSFGMDTPGGLIDGKLDDFSPMGPSFAAGFESTPFSFGVDGAPDCGIQFDPKLSLITSSAGDEGGVRNRPVIYQRRMGESQSQFSPFAGELSPMSGGIRLNGSPIQSDHDEFSSRYDNSSGNAGFNPMASPPGRQQNQPSIPSLSAPGHSNQGNQKPNSLTSPVGSSNASALVQKSPFRLQLGTKPGETRQSLADINKMVRGPSAPPVRRSPSAPTHHGAPSTAFRSSKNITTPMKVPSNVASITPGTHAGRPSLNHQNSSKSNSVPPQRYPHMTQKSNPRMIGKTSIKTPPGKENSTPKNKRSPCNCKKSKCLKLYCECFAAEIFCDRCNCADCHNTPQHENVRGKAIKDTRAKNPNAFKARIANKPITGPVGCAPPAAGHNMGCRCKKSECLKKYCECFQAGVMCGNKCKCIECLNYVGSQALIDKRRKIKDHRGAEFAMRTADDAWKQGRHGPRTGGVPPHVIGTLPQNVQGRHSMQGRRPPPGHMNSYLQPSPGQPRHGPPRAPHHSYMAPPPHSMMGPPHMGYSPMGMPPAGTPGYAPTSRPNPRMEERRPGGLSAARSKFNAAHQRTPIPVTPRTPAVRRRFDPYSSKQKRRLSPGSKEPSFRYYGEKLPEQPKTAALAIFSFLSGPDLYNAGIVCKRWNDLAFDEELWQF